MIKGKSLMIGMDVGLGYQTVAMATSCTLDLSTSVSDATTKDDDDSGANNEVTGASVSVKTENLIPAKSGPLGPNQLTNILKAGSSVKLRFSIFDGALNRNTPNSDWYKESEEVVEDIIMSVDAIVESVKISAANKQNATMSASFKGKGMPTIS